MNAMRCFHCGLINWDVGELCEHCGHNLPTEESFDHALYLYTGEKPVASPTPAKVLHARRDAGLWFAGAGAIPAVLFVLSFTGLYGLFSPEGLLFTILPVVIAGVCGAWLGSSILDQARVRTTGQAAWRGFLVAAVSFLLFALFLSLPSGSIATFFILVFYGSIIIGWLVATVGALAGVLLYNRRSNFN